MRQHDDEAAHAALAQRGGERRQLRRVGPKISLLAPVRVTRAIEHDERGVFIAMRRHRISVPQQRPQPKQRGVQRPRDQHGDLRELAAREQLLEHRCPQRTATAGDEHLPTRHARWPRARVASAQGVVQQRHRRQVSTYS